MKKILLTLLLFLSFAQTSSAQLTYGVDLYNRYVWRGLDLDNGLSLQPTLEFSKGNFTIGTWANVPLASGAAHKALQEVDLYAYYSIGFGDASLDLGVTDYLVSGQDDGSLDFGNIEDQHLFELNVRLNGSERLPLVVSFNKNLAGSSDADKSAHASIAYPFSLKGIDLKATVGTGLTKGDYYGVTEPGLIETSLEVGKTFGFIPKHDTTIKFIGVYNPAAEAFYPVVGISIWRK